jgi:Ser/Thr protein kinase RdoA (MazF antagonist)
LGEAGLPVPKVVPSVDGGLFAVVPDGQGRGHQVDVQRWVEDSIPLGDAAEAWAGKDGLNAETFEQLGELCGRLHATARDLGRISGYSRQAWDGEGLSGPAPLWGDPRRLAETDEDRSIIAEALSGIRTHLARLGTGPDVYGIIHADFTPENVLTSQGRLTLIDFDDFGEGWWLFDLATVLFWYHRHPRAEEYREALLQGYERHSKTPEGAVEALDVPGMGGRPARGRDERLPALRGPARRPGSVPRIHWHGTQSGPRPPSQP